MASMQRRKGPDVLGIFGLFQPHPSQCVGLPTLLRYCFIRGLMGSEKRRPHLVRACVRVHELPCMKDSTISLLSRMVIHSSLYSQGSTTIAMVTGGEIYRERVWLTWLPHGVSTSKGARASATWLM